MIGRGRSSNRILAIAAGAGGLLAVLVATAQASPRDLDPTFGDRGQARGLAGFESTEANDLILREDGSLVVVGLGSLGLPQQRALLAGYTADGRLDPSFGTGGIASGPEPEGSVISVSAEATADGGLVAAVSTSYPAPDLVLMRFDSDGQPDLDFGGDGVVETGLDFSNWELELQLDSSGRTVVGGTAPEGSPVSGTRVARFRQDGSLDTSFGGDGTVHLGSSRYLTAMTALPDGGVLVAYQPHGDFSGPRLARLTANGSADRTFGADGNITLAHNIGIGDLLTDGSGRVIAAGAWSGADGRPQALMARFTDTGAPDRAFAGDGVTKVRAGSSAGLLDITRQRDGRLVGVGFSEPTYDEYGAPQDALTLRLKPGGALDRTFSGDGLAIDDLGGDGDRLSTVVVQPSGRIVAAGTAIDYGLRSSYGDWALLGYRGTPPPGDRDSDGFKDAVDRCKRVPASAHQGCPLIDRRIRLINKPQAGLVGRVRAEAKACERRVKIRLFHERIDAPDRVLEIARSGKRRGTFKFGKVDVSGRVYAIAPRRVEPRLGVCRRAHTRRIRAR